MMRQAKLIDYICTESEALGFLDDIAKNTVSSLLHRNPRITPLFSDRAVSELEKGCRVRLSQLYKNPVLEKILRNARDIDPVMAADLEKMDDAVSVRQTGGRQKSRAMTRRKRTGKNSLCCAGMNRSSQTTSSLPGKSSLRTS